MDGKLQFVHSPLPHNTRWARFKLWTRKINEIKPLSPIFFLEFYSNSSGTWIERWLVKLGHSIFLSSLNIIILIFRFFYVFAGGGSSAAAASANNIIKFLKSTGQVSYHGFFSFPLLNRH